MKKENRIKPLLKKHVKFGARLLSLMMLMILISGCSQEIVLQEINSEADSNQGSPVSLDSHEEDAHQEEAQMAEENEVMPQEGLTPIHIQMNDIQMTGTLNSTVTAEAFKARLPFDIRVSRAADDLCGSVSETLPSDPSEGQEAWHLGEIGWFGGWFTILVDHEENFANMPGVMIIGSVDDEYLDTLASLKGSVDISISLAEENEKTEEESEEKIEEKAIESDQAYVFEEVPESYFSVANHEGTLEYFTYETAGVSEDVDDSEADLIKEALVYLPYGYEENQQASYNILYLMHGASGSENSWFGGTRASTSLKNIIDNMIEKGDIEPLIVVAPTYYRADSHEDDNQQTHAFQREFEKDLMPAIESHYRTYALSTSQEDLIASRDHRAFGGYSMGGVTTWYAFAENMAYIKYFMPMSGDSWIEGMMGGSNYPEETAQALSQAVSDQGYTKDDFKVYQSVGENDIAHDGVLSMMAALEDESQVFVMTDHFSTGNLHYDIAPGHYHDYPYGNHNIYNALKTFFKAY